MAQPDGPEPDRIDRLAERYGTVHKVTKQCYLCGVIWTGNAFAEYPADAPPLPGICPSCAEKEEAELARLKGQRTVSESGQELPPLEKPRRPFSDLEEPEL